MGLIEINAATLKAREVAVKKEMCESEDQRIIPMYSINKSFLLLGIS